METEGPKKPTSPELPNEEISPREVVEDSVTGRDGQDSKKIEELLASAEKVRDSMSDTYNKLLKEEVRQGVEAERRKQIESEEKIIEEHKEMIRTLAESLEKAWFWQKGNIRKELDKLIRYVATSREFVDKKKKEWGIK